MATEPGLGEPLGEDLSASPAHIRSPELRREARKAAVWVGVVGLAALAVYISDALLVIFGALVFAAMLDGGARLLGRVLPIGRGWRIGLVVLLAIGFFAWLVYFAGSQISVEAAALPAVIREQSARGIEWLRSHGFDVSMGH